MCCCSSDSLGLRLSFKASSSFLFMIISRLRCTSSSVRMNSFIMPMSTQRLSRQAWQCRRLSLVMRQSPLKGQVNRALRFMLRLKKPLQPSQVIALKWKPVARSPHTPQIRGTFRSKSPGSGREVLAAIASIPEGAGASRAQGCSPGKTHRSVQPKELWSGGGHTARFRNKVY